MLAYLWRSLPNLSGCSRHCWLRRTGLATHRRLSSGRGLASHQHLLLAGQELLFILRLYVRFPVRLCLMMQKRVNDEFQAYLVNSII